MNRQARINRRRDALLLEDIPMEKTFVTNQFKSRYGLSIALVVVFLIVAGVQLYVRGIDGE